MKENVAKPPARRENSAAKMYMGMEVQFDFEAPPVDEFTRRLCLQVESNIENARREERVQRKRRELRERIKVQIVTSPYTMTPTSSVIDSNRRDSLALPHERGTFTPFQKTPFKRCIAEIDRKSSSVFGQFQQTLPNTPSPNQVKAESAMGSPGDLFDATVFKRGSRTSSSSVSTNSSYSLICSPPILSLSPLLGVPTPTKASYALKDFLRVEEDESSTTSTLQTNDDNYIHVKSRREKITAGAGEGEELDKISEQHGMEYVQEEFFWIVDYRGTEKIFDSDAFTFAGTRFRLTFGPNTSVNTRNSSGYSLLLAFAQSHGEAYVACEFSVHGLLRPTFCRKCTRNLHFTSKSSVYRGYQHFMGPELLSYLESGSFTFSVTLKSFMGSKGELLGMPNPLGGMICGPKGGSSDNNSEVVSKSESGVEEECRIDDIYPGQKEDCYYQSGREFSVRDRNSMCVNLRNSRPLSRDFSIGLQFKHSADM